MIRRSSVDSIECCSADADRLVRARRRSRPNCLMSRRLRRSQASRDSGARSAAGGRALRPRRIRLQPAPAPSAASTDAPTGSSACSLGPFVSMPATQRTALAARSLPRFGSGTGIEEGGPLPCASLRPGDPLPRLQHQRCIQRDQCRTFTGASGQRLLPNSYQQVLAF